MLLSGAVFKSALLVLGGWCSQRGEVGGWVGGCVGTTAEDGCGGRAWWLCTGRGQRGRWEGCCVQRAPAAADAYLSGCVAHISTMLVGQGGATAAGGCTAACVHSAARAAHRYHWRWDLQEMGRAMGDPTAVYGLCPPSLLLLRCCYPPGRLLQHMDETPGFDAGQLQVSVGVGG